MNRNIVPRANSHQTIELLAPAGNHTCVRAAVANGANAIYFGLNSGFNARARAENFRVEDLPELLDFLHRFQVRGYVTLNTLVFTEELEAAETLVRQIYDAGVDAVLVQDLGLARLIRQIAPELPVHASTQMSLTSAEGIAAAQSLGLSRVVLPRELSIDEIARIHEETSLPLEAFVHGALCVAYSGQCLTSESLGGRSANRGQCAQACRLPYELVRDGETVDLAEQKYLLSPQDLAAYALIPDLLSAGVVSFKIEGRLKSPEYVANITRHYREAIDTALQGRPVQFTPLQIEEMELSFSRGFSVGWLRGCDHKALVPAVSSAKRGVLLGTVAGLNEQRQRISLRLRGPLKAGDGIVFAGDRVAGSEQGGRVFALFKNGRRIDAAADGELVEIELHQHAVDPRLLQVGQAIWKTDDPALTARLRKTYSGHIPERPQSVCLRVRANVGCHFELVASVPGQPELTLEGSEILAPAIKHPLTEPVLREQLGRLGGSGFALGELQAEIAGDPMMPLSQLGLIRRQLIAALRQQRDLRENTRPPLSEKHALPELRKGLPARFPEVSPPQLTVLCRTLDQLKCLLETEATHLYVDFQDIREYREAVSLARQHGKHLSLATPRIQKPGELGIFKAMAKHQPAGILARNLAGLAYFHREGIPCVADFSLNAANELTVDWLLRETRAERVTPSFDLNRDQLLQLARHGDPARLEVVIHQHMPMFHMEHCVFCALLSPGTNKTNCGRPCDRHVVQLRDRVGAEHPLVADVGCRNTVYNHTPQSGAEVTADLRNTGLTWFRIELLNENSSKEILRIVQLYLGLLAEEVSPGEVWRELHAMNRIGLTQGTLEHERNPLAIV